MNTTIHNRALVLWWLAVITIIVALYRGGYFQSKEARLRAEARAAAKIMGQIVNERFQQPPYDKLFKDQ
jgi:hypothetical protein